MADVYPSNGRADARPEIDHATSFDPAHDLGTSLYEVTFPKGQLPPVKAFWSLTVYNPEHLFYPNALERFALGTKNKTLKYNDDGSLTIYLGNQSPGKERETNWLPAPAGEFSIWVRAYWPDQAILDGTWKPPVVKTVN